MEQFEAKTSAFYFLFEKQSQKTFREEGFPKCLESKSILRFLRHICRKFVVFRRNKVVLRRVVLYNASLSVPFNSVFIFGLYNKALKVCYLGKQLVLFSLGPRCFPRLRLGTKALEALGKTKLFHSGPDIKCILYLGHLDQQKIDPHPREPQVGKGLCLCTSTVNF